MSRYCCEDNEYDWSIPDDGMYWSQDYKQYFENNNKKAFLIKTPNSEKENGAELVGFLLLDEVTENSSHYFEIGEFYIIAKFQKKNIGKYIAHKIFDMFPGKWRISVIPANKPGYNFWLGSISDYTEGSYVEEIKNLVHDAHQVKRIILSFDTNNKEPQTNIIVSKSVESDVASMVKLSYKKRREYENAQPQFWKWAGEVGEKTQFEWFAALLKDDKYIALSAKEDDEVVGFIIGRLVSAPEVYDPGGLTVVVDDFCVSNENTWQTVGVSLIKEIKAIAIDNAASQIVVVSGDHDKSKCNFLEKLGLTVASRWYVGEV
jgi:predicted acetyltransferase